LFPVDVEGKGRVLLNVPAEEADEIIGTPAKKRAVGKKKKSMKKHLKDRCHLVII